MNLGESRLKAIQEMFGKFLRNYNKHANLWIAKVAGVVKTKDEAQALVDAEIQAAQASGFIT